MSNGLIENLNGNNEPTPLRCEYCNEEMRYIPIRILGDKVIHWVKPEYCECQQSQEQKKFDEEKKAKELQEQRDRETRELKQMKVNKLFDNSKVGERFKQRNFNNFTITNDNKIAYEICKSYSDNFLNNKGMGILLSGSYGIGKTHLVCSITNELINREIPVICGTFITLLGKIKQTYTANTDEWQILDLYTDIDLLIIDDLGKEKITEWALEKLYYIINQRYEKLKPVIITTNYGNTELIKKLTVDKDSSTAEAIVSRLNEMCKYICFKSIDYRKK